MASVIFLGTSAATPSLRRGFSSIGVLDAEDITLMDCGDGAIRNLLKFNIDIRKISSILISHYHSDHISGLTQIIETMGMKKRTETLNIFGPAGLKEYFSIVQKITNVAFKRMFQINLNELSPRQEFSLAFQKVRTFEMDHTLPCLGYRLETKSGVVSYTGDTQPSPSIVELGKNADLFIHEATFLQRDVEQARLTKHSISKEAAEDASKAAAHMLILTHVNDDYESPEEMKLEAEKLFKNVLIAYDGLKLEISKP